jgi:hypothetical protein
MIIGKRHANGAEVLSHTQTALAGRCTAMKTCLDDSTAARNNAKGSPYSISRVNVLRGYIYPSDYSVANTFGLVGLGGRNEA